MENEPERPSSQRLESLLPALKFVLPYRMQIGFALVALIITASVSLSVPLGLRFLIDEGLSANGAELLTKGIFIFVGLGIVLALGTFTRFYFISWVGERVSADIRVAVYDRLVALHPGFFEENAPTEIQSRITTDTTLLQTVVGSSASVALRNILTFFGGVILLFATNPKLSIVVLVCVPLVVFPVLMFGRRVRRLSRTSQDTLADVGSHVGESLRSIKLVQAFRRERRDLERFKERVALALDVAIRRIRQRAWLVAVVMILVMAAIAVMVYIGGQDVLAGRTTPGELAAFLIYAFLVAGSVGAISEVWGDLQRAAGATERLMELLKAVPEIETPTDPVAMTRRGAVAFDGVTFAYSSRPTERVLDGIELAVEPGEMLAIVGPSGAGKSTLLNLLLRFYDATGGVVRLGGADVRSLDLNVLRRAVAFVPQDAALAQGTIAENVAYGLDRETDDRVERALGEANAAAFVRALPDGVGTRIAEGGQGLSGGQRQRVAIARALAVDPDVLLMDEATSALDAVSEDAIVTTLNRLRGSRTVIIVAHRLSTVLAADRIVVMDQGTIIGEGTHQTLLETSPLYREFAEIQLKSPVPVRDSHDVALERGGANANAAAALGGVDEVANAD